MWLEWEGDRHVPYFRVGEFASLESAPIRPLLERPPPDVQYVVLHATPEGALVILMTGRPMMTHWPVIWTAHVLRVTPDGVVRRVERLQAPGPTWSRGPGGEPGFDGDEP